MNNFEDVYSLNRDERQISNLETYRRFISKGDKPLQCINDEDAKAIKDALNGKGKILAVVDGRRSMAGNHKYVLFVKEEGGVKVYLFTVLNGLYNEMGPYKDLDTAMSNADCYGLFEECKQVANKKVLNEDIEDEEEFEDWDSEGFDDVCEGDMEDFFNPRDSWPTNDTEQMWADEDDALIADSGIPTVKSNIFGNDTDDISDEYMDMIGVDIGAEEAPGHATVYGYDEVQPEEIDIDDADLDAWVNEGKQTPDNKLKEGFVGNLLAKAILGADPMKLANGSTKTWRIWNDTGDFDAVANAIENDEDCKLAYEMFKKHYGDAPINMYVDFLEEKARKAKGE